GIATITYAMLHGALPYVGATLELPSHNGGVHGGFYPSHLSLLRHDGSHNTLANFPGNGFATHARAMLPILDRVMAPGARYSPQEVKKDIVFLYFLVHEHLSVAAYAENRRTAKEHMPGQRLATIVNSLDAFNIIDLIPLLNDTGYGITPLTPLDDESSPGFPDIEDAVFDALADLWSGFRSRHADLLPPEYLSIS
ncbi:MAG: hypothetical protein ABW051_10895, partial [Burkholderiaceae bacterium]